MTSISPYIRQTVRSLERAQQDIARQSDSRIILFDEVEPVQRCKNHGCGLKLYTTAEEARGLCWPCLKERS